MINYLRLMRPTNLMMVVVSMYSLGFYLDIVYCQNTEWGSIVFSLTFLLFALSTALVAAAGNVINDYFDTAADIVNKPEALIVGKRIEAQKVFRFYVLLNIASVLMVLYVSIDVGSYIFLAINLTAIFLLWLYSKSWKKKLFVSNILVALLTALVSIQVGIYFNHYFDKSSVYVKSLLRDYKQYAFYLGLLFGLLAFGLNWLREIVKDMEDVEGDKVIGSRSIPIVYGLKKSKIIFFIVAMLVLVQELILVYVIQLRAGSFLPAILIWINILSLVYAIILTILAVDQKDLKRADLGLKISMIFVLLVPFYWTIYFYLI